MSKLTTAIHQIDFIDKKDEHSDIANEQEISECLQLPAKPVMTLNLSENLDKIGEQLAEIMSCSPFLKLTNTCFNFDKGDKTFTATTTATPDLIGNASYQILHGGVSATVLDTLGGLIAMYEILRREQDSFDERVAKATRVATVDLRIDYLAVGRGAFYVATGEIMRMGRKGCTVRMMFVDDNDKPIAHGIASYTF
ncbi:thioesterase family protein [Faucicola boevrei]|uniref:thioesterase family protein n=1 Tax=Faucicola boevrei TaxID=346665 RepID=UPI00036788A5|nr:thioesterase family protein [Moraxella boevrei]